MGRLRACTREGPTFWFLVWGVVGGGEGGGGKRKRRRGRDFYLLGRWCSSVCAGFAWALVGQLRRYFLELTYIWRHCSSLWVLFSSDFIPKTCYPRNQGPMEKWFPVQLPSINPSWCIGGCCFDTLAKPGSSTKLIYTEASHDLDSECSCLSILAALLHVGYTCPCQFSCCTNSSCQEIMWILLLIISILLMIWCSKSMNLVLICNGGGQW